MALEVSKIEIECFWLNHAEIREKRREIREKEKGPGSFKGQVSPWVTCSVLLFCSFFLYLCYK